MAIAQFAWAHARGAHKVGRQLRRLSAVLLLLLVCAQAPAAHVESRATVAVSINTRHRIQIEPGFAGYNVALMDAAFGWTDPRFVAQVRRLGPAWLRFPAGTRAEAFDWATGTSRQAWVDEVSRTFSSDVQADFREILQRTLEVLAAKGGERLDEAAVLARVTGGRGLIVCVNVFTDTPASAKRFAAYATQHRIPVLAWELGNEPYFNSGLWPTSAAYADAVRPFANAIREADPRAKIAVSMSDAGFQDPVWDDSLASFQPRYWDLVVYHHYPTISGTPAAMIAVLNEALLHRTTGYVSDEVGPRFGSMPIIITEAGPQDGPSPGMDGTMYGGIWAAEYALRMSSLPQVKHFGIHQLLGSGGVGVTNGHVAELIDATKAGVHLDVASLDFGLYESAEAVGYSLAAAAINSAASVYRTSVAGGGTAPLPDGGSMPAVFAQAYRVGNGTSVMLTNKGERAETASIAVDGEPAQRRFHVVTVSAPDPSATNAVGRELVTTSTSVTARVISLPPYSVVRVDW